AVPADDGFELAAEAPLPRVRHGGAIIAFGPAPGSAPGAVLAGQVLDDHTGVLVPDRRAEHLDHLVDDAAPLRLAAPRLHRDVVDRVAHLAGLLRDLHSRACLERTLIGGQRDGDRARFGGHRAAP